MPTKKTGGGMRVLRGIILVAFLSIIGVDEQVTGVMIWVVVALAVLASRFKAGKMKAGSGGVRDKLIDRSIKYVTENSTLSKQEIQQIKETFVKGDQQAQKRYSFQNTPKKERLSYDKHDERYAYDTNSDMTDVSDEQANDWISTQYVNASSLSGK